MLATNKGDLKVSCSELQTYNIKMNSAQRLLLNYFEHL